MSFVKPANFKAAQNQWLETFLSCAMTAEYTTKESRLQES